MEQITTNQSSQQCWTQANDKNQFDHSSWNCAPLTKCKVVFHNAAWCQRTSKRLGGGKLREDLAMALPLTSLSSLHLNYHILKTDSEGTLSTHWVGLCASTGYIEMNQTDPFSQGSLPNVGERKRVLSARIEISIGCHEISGKAAHLTQFSLGQSFRISQGSQQLS